MSSDDHDPDDALVLRMSTVTALATNIARCPVNPSPNTHKKFAGLVQELVYQANVTADYLSKHSRTRSPTPDQTRSPTPPESRDPPRRIWSRPVLESSSGSGPPSSRRIPSADSPSALCTRSRRSSSASPQPEPSRPMTPPETKARFLLITQPDNNCTSPQALLDYLVTPSAASNEERENSGFRRLIFGYQSSSIEVWNDVFSDFVGPTPSLDSLCAMSSVHDTFSVQENLRHRDLFLTTRVPKEAVQRYIDYLVRSIETLKFMLVWNALEQKPGGRETKKRHLIDLHYYLYPKPYATLDSLRDQFQEEQLFHKEAEALQTKARLEQLTEENKTHMIGFVRAHQRTITARNTLLTLYQKFGASVFLDPIWDVHSQTTKSGLNGRSETFRNTLKYVCANVHVTSENNSAAISLARVTGGQDLAQLVETFINTSL